MKVPLLPRHYVDTLGHWGMILLGLVSASALGGLSLIVLARRVTPLEYGQYVAIFSLVTVTAVLPRFGLAAWALAQSDAAQRFGRRFWYATVGPRLPGLLVWVALILLAAPLLSPATYPPAILAPILISVFFETILAFGFSYLRARGDYKLVTVVQAATGVSLLLLVVLAPLEPGRLWLFAVGRMLISLLGAGGLAYYIHRQTPSDALAHRDPPVRGGVRASASFFLAEAASVVYLKADVTIVGLYAGAAGASIYGPASNLLVMTFLISQALFFYMVPRLSSAANAQDAGFRRSASRQLLLQLGAGLLVSAGLFVLAPTLVLTLFGPQYAASIPLLRLFGLIPVLRGVTSGLATILIAVRRQPERTAVQMVTATVSVIGALLVIERFGLMGVAWVFVATEALNLAGHAYLVAGGRLLPTSTTAKEAAT